MSTRMSAKDLPQPTMPLPAPRSRLHTGALDVDTLLCEAAPATVQQMHCSPFCDNQAI